MALDSKVIVWVALGTFNLCLAAMLAGAKPRRLANFLAAVIMAGNGFFGLLEAIVQFRDLKVQELIIFGNTPTLFALVLLPFVFPRRVLSRNWEHLLLAVGGLLTVGNWALLVIPGVTVRNAPADPILAWTAFLPFFVGLGVGTFILLNEYLASPSPILREQARFLLAAYCLKVVSYLSVFWTGNILEGRPVGPPGDVFYLNIFTLILCATIGGVIIAIVASRLRPRKKDVPARPWTHDAFVLGIAAIAIPLTSWTIADAEYMLIRPLLITYGILRFQLLDVDARGRRALVYAGTIIGIGTVFTYAAYKMETLGATPGVATGVAITLTLAVGVPFAWPLLRLASSGASRESAHGDEIYRAALEEAAASKTGQSTTGEPILRALRSRLQISEREHASMEASVEALFGRRGADIGVGRTVFGRYTVTALLGEGGFGRTFLAKDDQMHRQVVLKASRTASPEEASRVLREAQIVARLRHPNVVTIHDVEQVGGDCFLVLEFVSGGSLAERRRLGPVPWREAAALMDDVLSALEAAHAQGIIHRDVKPANILLTEQGRAKLVDFGIARAPSSNATALGLSMTGTNPGSLPYMSPEQVRGAEVDSATDLYSLAATVYEILAGRPYLDLERKNEFEVRLAVLDAKPRFPIPAVPAALNELLKDCLAKDPRRRPLDATTVRARLGAILAAPQGPKSPRRK